jgi:hypothetical protein
VLAADVGIVMKGMPKLLAGRFVGAKSLQGKQVDRHLHEYMDRRTRTWYQHNTQRQGGRKILTK